MSGLQASRTGTACFRVATENGTFAWQAFNDPLEIVQASDLDQVFASLSRVQTLCQSGYWAAGFIAYEAGPAFDPAIQAHPPIPGLPLIWFGIYENPTTLNALETSFANRPLEWKPSISKDTFLSAVAKIRELIAQGDTYQTNFTFRLLADFEGDPLGLFQTLYQAQPTNYAAFVDLGRFAICSASPELFFERHGNRLVSKPMKGTAARGENPTSDVTNAQGLALDPKNRAENLMIVDMVRNDLGRIAEVGSVTVEQLFEVESYETLHQMTSTVAAQSRAPLEEVLRVLFPPASITGAPKARTTEIIRDLEGSPRGIYTGCLGVIAPGGDARFNVAIRTALFDRELKTATFGIGSGIVWDSVPEQEYEECLLKAKSLLWEAKSSPTSYRTHVQPVDFQLFETFAWTAEEGFRNLELHLNRLQNSANALGFAYDRVRLFEALRNLEMDDTLGPKRIRLTLSQNGTPHVETATLVECAAQGPVRVGLARTPICADNLFLRHKTTRREVYDRARAERPDCDDMILWNEAGMLTETTIANLVVRCGDEWVTPPLECGLLPGIQRSILIEQGKIREQAIPRDALTPTVEIALISSLRGWRNAMLVP